MATTRLRRAFRYPGDSDDERGREELDEEEQERIIEQLQKQNSHRNAQYSILFTVLPLLSIIIFLPSILSSKSTPGIRFFSILGIGSLVATAFTMRHFSLYLPDPKGKRSVAETERITAMRNALVFGNSALCGFLALVCLLAGISSSVIWPALYLVPGAMLGVILIAKEAMTSVDVSHLHSLRYAYKGA